MPLKNWLPSLAGFVVGHVGFGCHHRCAAYLNLADRSQERLIGHFTASKQSHGL